jgi:hypothetical protein
MAVAEDPTLAGANLEAAQLAAEKARLELAEWKSPAAVGSRAAQRNADTAKAEKSVLDSSFAQFAGAVPDLSNVSAGSTTVDAGTQLFGSALALQALRQASRDAAADIANAIPSAQRSKYLLVTTEVDLASTDAMFAQVNDGLVQLVQAAQALTRPVVAYPPTETADGSSTGHPESVIAAAVGVAAAALPAVVSLFSANRKISGASLIADDIQAVMGVAAAMVQQQSPPKVLMDDFRTVDRTGPISDLLNQVSTERLALARRKAELTGSTSPADSSSLALIGQVSSAIESFLTAILAVPSGATRSAYTSAILRERLHDGSVGVVVLVKGVGGSTAQVVNDRPLWFKDKFTTIASAGLSWLMIAPGDGAVIAGGAKVSTLEVNGTIGAGVKVKPATPVPA